MRVYLFESKAFACIDKFAEHLMAQKIYGLGTIQDCLDWIVYSPYVDIDLNLDQDMEQSISYGMTKSDTNGVVYFFDKDSYWEYIQNDQDIQEYVWYQDVKIIL